MMVDIQASDLPKVADGTVDSWTPSSLEILGGDARLVRIPSL